MSPRRDPYFGRFAFTVFMVGVVLIVLGLAAIWYYFQGGSAPAQQPGAGAAAGALPAGSKLPPNRALLYYTPDGQMLTGVVAEIGSPGTTASEKAMAIMSALLDGRGKSQLRTAVPAGTRLNAAFVQDGVVIVNLSRDFLNNLRGGVDAELLAAYSIVNSLLYNLENADSVQILIDGAKVPTLGGNLDLDAPLIANTAVTRAN
jgi:spore germination protein GerM